MRRKWPRFIYPKAIMVEALRVKPTSTLAMIRCRLLVTPSPGWRSGRRVSDRRQTPSIFLVRSARRADFFVRNCRISHLNIFA
jgi:hypothetical protein